MSITNKLISTYITSALYHIGISRVIPMILLKQKGSSLDSARQTEYDAGLELISLTSSAATLLLDNLVNKSLFPDNKVVQHICSGIETLGLTSLIAKVCQLEPLKNVLESSVADDILDKNSFYMLGGVLLRNIILKQVWDNNIDVDSIGDLRELVGFDTGTNMAYSLVS
jgi:hypothetical protein